MLFGNHILKYVIYEFLKKVSGGARTTCLVKVHCAHQTTITGWLCHIHITCVFIKWSFNGNLSLQERQLEFSASAIALGSQLRLGPIPK